MCGSSVAVFFVIQKEGTFMGGRGSSGLGGVVVMLQMVKKEL